MEDIKWIFDGIGTELLSLVIGSLIGGIVGFKIGVNITIKSNNQKQKAGDNSSQVQIGEKNVR